VGALVSAVWATMLLVAPTREYTGPGAVEGPVSGVPDGVVPAQPGPGLPQERSSEASRPRPGEPEPEPEAEPIREVTVAPRRAPQTEPDRAGSVVTRADLDERLPRSAPDALRGEPGVFIQQTAHGQASPYVRGMTGQQTVMYFDGVRLNNATFRQGPNQYFFTIDSHTIQRLEVVRGAASVRYGSDAMGGALLSTPIEPSLDLGDQATRVHARGMFTTATADAQMGGRAQVQVSHKGKVAFMAGAGYREVGLLRSGGRVIAPATGRPQNVPPLFAADGKTQRGTGFDEVTADARLVWRPVRKHKLTLGYYDYRQLNAPRTDRCPPPTAPQDECLTYREQFRTLVYAGHDLEDGPAAAETVSLRLSYQNQHEDREHQRGASPTRLDGVDDVHSVGGSARLRTKDFVLAPWLAMAVAYGSDAFYDRISSEARQTFQDTGVSVDTPYTQYADGSGYLSSGAWGELQTTLSEVVRLRVGGRAALVHARAPEFEARQSSEVRRTWGTAVGNAGVSWQAVPWLRLVFNVDQGFRAPNLDDLTSRQQTGPGFQFENPDLRPERTLMLETGLKIEHPWFEVDAFVFQTYGFDLMQRAPVSLSACPMGDPGCGAAQTRFQLVNLDGTAVLRGADGEVRIYLPKALKLRTTLSYAWGEGPMPGQMRGTGVRTRTPLSRIPPWNGLVELGWRPALGLYLIGAMRWALIQDRLAVQDVDDPRIPDGGTPGFVTVDVRAGYRLDPHVLFGLVFENVSDVAYRHHGSSINGPGRGVMLHVEFGF
jgi:outer membrane receptor protein involved in Fe transport